MEMPIAVELDFSVLYEDEEVIVVGKAAPLLTHPTGTKDDPTLWHGLQELLMFELATGGRISFINRLDRETSGITLVAKTARAARALGRAMQRREMQKRYVAVLRGIPAWYEASCRLPILRRGDVEPCPIHVRQCCHADGKASRTDFTLLAGKDAKDGCPAMSLVSCAPVTGRMHQIRVHLEHLGYPIVGDKIYGGDGSGYLRFMEEGWTSDVQALMLFHRQALHASYLSFPHPCSGELVEVRCPLPLDMQDLWGADMPDLSAL